MTSRHVPGASDLLMPRCKPLQTTSTQVLQPYFTFQASSFQDLELDHTNRAALVLIRYDILLRIGVILPRLRWCASSRSSTIQVDDICA